MQITPATPTRSNRRRVAAFLSAGAAALALTAGVAGAAEIGTGGGGGGGGGGTAVCNPVTSLTAKGDPKVGELGFAAADVTYAVKPCDADPVIVHVTVAEWADATQVVYDNPDAVLNGKFRVNGIKIRTTYKVSVEVTDAITGVREGLGTTFVAAVPKGV